MFKWKDNKSIFAKKAFDMDMPQNALQLCLRRTRSKFFQATLYTVVLSQLLLSVHSLVAAENVNSSDISNFNTNVLNSSIQSKTQVSNKTEVPFYPSLVSSNDSLNKNVTSSNAAFVFGNHTMKDYSLHALSLVDPTSLREEYDEDVQVYVHKQGKDGYLDNNELITVTVINKRKNLRSKQ